MLPSDTVAVTAADPSARAGAGGPGIPIKLLTGEPMTLANWLNASLGWIASGNIDLATGKIEEVAAELVARDEMATSASRSPAAGGVAPVIRWRPGPAPQDGSEFWAYRGVMGIQRMLWISAEAAAREDGGDDADPQDYEEGYGLADDHDDVWTPKWWVPLEEIPDPYDAAPASPAETKAALADATFDLAAPTHRVEAGAVAGDLGGAEAALDDALDAFELAIRELISGRHKDGVAVQQHKHAVIADRRAAVRVAHLAARDRELDSPGRSGAAGDGVRWRHVKRETVYTEIGRAELQCSDVFTDPTEGDVLVVYRGRDGKLWAREEREFEDGRFTRISAEDRAQGAQGREGDHA